MGNKDVVKIAARTVKNVLKYVPDGRDKQNLSQKGQGEWAKERSGQF
jgi:hypothetical protein